MTANGSASASEQSSVKGLAEGVSALSLDTSKLTPLSPEVISRQATINIGTIGHVAHGKSTVVKAISGVQTVRFKNELVRNITIKLGYANAKVSWRAREGVCGKAIRGCASLTNTYAPARPRRSTSARRSRARGRSATAPTRPAKRTARPVKCPAARGE